MENGSTTLLLDKLPVLFQWQAWDIQPESISNQVKPFDATQPPLTSFDSTFHILADAGGVDVGQYGKMLWTRDNNGKWTFANVALPQGTSITQWTTINSSGVIAAIGNAGTGDGHALLLFPVNFFKPNPDYNASTANVSQTNNKNSTSVATDDVTVLNRKYEHVDGTLKVAKLDGSFGTGYPCPPGPETAGLIQGVSTSGTNGGPAWLEADPDRFYVQVDAPPNSGPLYARLWTTNPPPNQSYDDPGTAYPVAGHPNSNIILNEVRSGIYRSLPQILVSDAEDQTNLQKSYSPNGYGNAPGQVHLIALGGSVKLSYTPSGQTNEQTFPVATVPVRKTFFINFYDVCYPPPGSSTAQPTLPKDQINVQLRSANERFAQAGIQFVNGGVNYPSYQVPFGGIPIGSETEIWPAAHSIMQYAGTPTTTDIGVYYVPYLGTTSAGSYAGHSFLALDGITGVDANNCFIGVNSKPYFTLAHELGHIIGGFNHDQETWHLMRGYPFVRTGTSILNVFNGSKRFTQDQGDVMINSNPNGLKSQ